MPSEPYVPLIVIGLVVAILVEAVESGEASEPSGSADAVAIRATRMSGNHTTSVAVAGPPESDAWAALAREAIAWRNSDFQHIRIWGSGG